MLLSQFDGTAEANAPRSKACHVVSLLEVVAYLLGDEGHIVSPRDTSCSWIEDEALDASSKDLGCPDVLGVP